MTSLTRVTALACTLSAAAALLAAPTALASPAHGQRIPFTEATVTAQDDGSYEIAWRAPGVRRVEIRAGGRTVAAGAASGTVTVTGLPAADRQWFDLVPDHGGGLHLADRLIRLDGTVNFRDVGGYRTTDGRWVRMGAVYRSDALDRLTDGDLAELRRLGISADYDFRTTSERAAAPDRVPEGARYVVADVLGGGSFTMPTTPAESERMMVEGERAMVTSDTAKAAYGTVFADLSDGDAAGVLYHCTAGKDRTGWASAALLTALGVPRETVMADYLASNDYRAEANAAALAALQPAQAAVYKPLLDVRPEYLNAGFAQIRQTYGSFTAYEKQALGLDAAEVGRLKAELLAG
ncbi:tyrosine-protein phosphatase [Streptomyces sp. NPDC051940]|uniref:tyrosine-protein phosphatase n=1 Tax=Streptomyces sp. NPDC051940 TaxID=3155675 RepID=UPI003439D6BB